MSPEELRARARALREAGEPGAAREMRARAMELELVAIAGLVSERESALEDAKALRLARIHDALDEGWTRPRIATAVGLSHQRIGQIADA
jgi:hypothetical protein